MSDQGLGGSSGQEARPHPGTSGAENCFEVGSNGWWTVRRVANGDERRPWYELTDEDRKKVGGAHSSQGVAATPSDERSERAFSRRLAKHVLDRPRGDPDDDLAVLSRQLLRADEAIEHLRQSWGKAEARLATQTALTAEVRDALAELMEMLRREAPGTPLNNHRFDALGARCTAAIAKATSPSASIGGS